MCSKASNYALHPFESDEFQTSPGEENCGSNGPRITKEIMLGNFQKGNHTGGVSGGKQKGNPGNKNRQ